MRFFNKIAENGNIWILCQNFWTNKDLDLISISKWPLEATTSQFRDEFKLEFSNWAMKVPSRAKLGHINFRAETELKLSWK